MQNDANKTYLITGAAGFIGYYVAKKLLEQGSSVIGIDSRNDYYDVKLKSARLEQLLPSEQFTFIQADIADKDLLMKTFAE
ncbi:MAG: SDR family NAD(P)-dependent oxidoreductase, partial [Firmicutes bacterium]|nr:SDR family NAD(P)-dependent oxidoreductase [Bacillota bacterium]